MTSPTPVLIDTDVAIDDWMALFYLLSNPACSVIGITTTGVGAAHLTPGTNVVLGLLQAAGRSTIPVAAGTSAPLIYSNVFPGSWRAIVDQAYGVPLPVSSSSAQPVPAADFLRSTILGSPSPVTILSIGGGTNLGTLFQQVSASTLQQLRANISGICMMGGVINQVGSVFVPGNVNSFNGDYLNTVAEWNIFIDVLGASLVLNAGIPITLIPLNACNQVLLDMSFYTQLQSFVNAKGPSAPAPAQIVYAGLS
ncbi:MAG TPA: nucleoside hydrolase, partial [Myxococcales bacterium]|nr:nucleoside hydrolase [Myxococcales bacterium]